MRKMWEHLVLVKCYNKGKKRGGLFGWLYSIYAESYEL